MQVIAHNLLSQFTNRQLNISTNSKGKSSEKLSSGYRINRAADDAAGLKISEKMRTQIRGLSRGEKNTQEGISWIQVGDGAMNEMMEITQRIRELAVQAANDTNSPLERNAIDNEIKELRKEINMISTNTEFNNQKIFDNSGVTIDVEGEFGDLEVYNASYDDATGEVTYGGFICDGYRVSWDTISQNMVTDVNGVQEFTGGSYIYREPNTGKQFHIMCEPGTEVPKITRNFSISADVSGILIDGIRHRWSEIRDENGNPPNGKITEGVWELNHNGASIMFVAGEIMDYSRMAEEINKSSKRYTWKMDYKGGVPVQAVDAKLIKNLRLSNSTVAMMQSEKLSFRVKADETGIWLENAFTNTVIQGSTQTWASMGIDDADWDSGDKISKKYTYTFKDSEGTNDTYVSFDFVMDDVTSIDSVIDGLDGMEIGGGPITNYYGAVPDVQLDHNVLSAYVNGGNKVFLSEEIEFDRDFDLQKIDNISANNKVSYDPATQKIQLSFSKDGNPVITYEGSSKEMEDYLQGDLSTFVSSIMPALRNQALNPGTVIDIKAPTLRDILGSDKVTEDGHLRETVTITSDMILTDGVDKSGIFEKGEVGKTYPAARIDFSVIGQSVDIMNLVGTGFNSDCKTCDNFYSIRFEDFSKGGTEANKVTSDGYRYNIREVARPNSDRSNFTLQIDLNSLTENNVTDGESLAKALISITSECLDMHYTQYAADGAIFYIYDNREQNSGAPSAAFDAIPLPRVDVDELGFRLTAIDGSNREMNMLFKYDFTDIADWVKIEMTPAANGQFVYKDPSDASQGYRRYNSATDANNPNIDRFDMEEKYVDKDGNLLNSAQEMIEKYVEYAMDKMMGNTNVSLNVLDYTYMEVSGDEKQNVAIKSIFESIFEEKGKDAGIHIQNSAIVHDSVIIPRFRMNTVVLNLHRAGTKTYDEAQATIAMADDAVRILSGKRSLYGAWQNRLEFIYENSRNMEINAQASESRIRDTDMADEMVRFSKHNILEQAGQAILAKANQSAQGILTLLSGSGE